MLPPFTRQALRGNLSKLGTIRTVSPICLINLNSLRAVERRDYGNSFTYSVYFPVEPLPKVVQMMV